MPHRKTPLIADRFYHIYNRGNDRQSIFFDRENYLYFLRLTREHIVESDIDILAYCLMPNHYHFLVYPRNDRLSDAMKKLSLSYTKSMNKRYNRSGVLFQGRFQSILVDNDSYLTYLAQYIHLNPVKSGLVEQAKDWEFSSYLEYAGLRQGTLPKTGYFRQMMPDDLNYQQFLTSDRLPSAIDFQKLLLE
jgi:putative transposase